MSTKLFEDIIIGPIKSRRLGRSLGVNLMPTVGKLCNFNCIYCECGWNSKGFEKLRYNDAGHVVSLLEERLKELQQHNQEIDVITFAGNGEPTMHPHFADVINSTIILRDRYMPDVKIAVLSNATMIGKEPVLNALMRVDRAILKIDSAIDHTIDIINKPCFKYSLRSVIDDMSHFNGEVIIQTMFLRGEYNGEIIDNTTEQEVSAWLDVIKEISPKMVMLYSIDRDTPADNLVQVSSSELMEIAQKVQNIGIECVTT